MQQLACTILILCFTSLRRESKKETEVERLRAGLEGQLPMMCDLRESLAIKVSSLESTQRMSMGRHFLRFPKVLSKRRYSWARM
jgi:hypothetical protein